MTVEFCDQRHDQIQIWKEPVSFYHFICVDTKSMWTLQAMICWLCSIFYVSLIMLLGLCSVGYVPGMFCLQFCLCAVYRHRCSDYVPCMICLKFRLYSVGFVLAMSTKHCLGLYLLSRDLEMFRLCSKYGSVYIPSFSVFVPAKGRVQKPQ